MAPAILDLLYSNFFRDEPMNSAIGLCDGVDGVQVLDEYVRAVLEDGLSLVAVDGKTNNLLGESSKTDITTVHIYRFTDSERI